MGVRSFALVTASLLAGWTTAVVGSPPEARDWLQKMTHAVQFSNYEGTFVYLHKQRLESMKIVHIVDGVGNEREHLLSLSGAAREVLRDDDTVSCILPNTRSVFVDKRRLHRAFPVIMPKDVEALETYYRLSLSGSDRVAGRDVQVLVVEPLDRFRYGYQLWLDVKTALPLKSYLVNEEGKPVEQFMFTSLRVYDHPVAESLVPSLDDEAFTPIERGGEAGPPALHTLQWKVDALPRGFALTSHGWRRLPDGIHDVEHMVFSDGLASLSIYIEPREERTGLQGISRMGPVSAYGRKDGNFQFTVVGEVPPDTVELVGQSIQPRYAKATP